MVLSLGMFSSFVANSIVCDTSPAGPGKPFLYCAKYFSELGAGLGSLQGLCFILNDVLTEGGGMKTRREKVV